MEVKIMYGLLFMLGIVISIFSILYLLVTVIRKKNSKKPLICLLCGIALFVIGFILTPSSHDINNEPNTEDSELISSDVKNGLTEKADTYIKYFEDKLESDKLSLKEIRLSGDKDYEVVYSTSCEVTYNVIFSDDKNFKGISVNQNGDSEEDKSTFLNLCFLSTFIPDFGINEMTDEISLSLAGVSEEKVSLDKCDMIYVDSLKYFIISLK